MTDEQIGKLIEKRQAQKREILSGVAGKLHALADECRAILAASDTIRAELEAAGIEVIDSSKDFDIGCQWRRK